MRFFTDPPEGKSFARIWLRIARGPDVAEPSERPDLWDIASGREDWRLDEVKEWLDDSSG